MINRILKFIKEVHSEDGKGSSKRIYGGISYLAVTTRIVGWQPELLETLLIVSASLIGLATVFSGIAKIKQK
jgi:hypothetical protein